MKTHAVVIAGGGATDLMLAAELALVRVDLVIVERRESHDLVGARRRQPAHSRARARWSVK